MVFNVVCIITTFINLTLAGVQMIDKKAINHNYPVLQFSGSNIKQNIMRIAAGLLTAVLVEAPLAQESGLSFDIPSQQASSALIAFGEQADMTVLVKHEARDIKVSGVYGTYTVEQAIEHLLIDTDLVYRFSNSSIIVSVKVEEKSLNSNDNMQMAVTGQTMVDTASSGLEEIIITAQKREQNLQDVGLAVTAFSGEQLDALGLVDSWHIGEYTPGLHVTTTNGEAYLAAYSVRGISQADYGDGQEAPVAIYIDDVYLSSPGMAAFPLFDLQRLEILKGPQGTLYGRNATGGLVHYVSNKPSDKFAASVDITVADYNQRKIIAVVNGPISDHMQGRLVVFSNRNDGYINDRIGPDLRTGHTDALRGMLNIDINDYSSLSVKANWADVDELGGGGYHTRASKLVNGLGVFCEAFDTDCGDGPTGANFSLLNVSGGQIDDGIGGKLDVAANRTDTGLKGKAWGLNIIYKAVFENFNIISISDFTHGDKVYSEDDDSLSETFVDLDSFANLNQYSHEFRINGQTQSMFWIAGLYYLHIDVEFGNSFAFPAHFGYTPRFEATTVTKSWAAFGQIEYALNDSWSLIAGIRYNHDHKNNDYQFVECDITEQAGIERGFCPTSLIQDPLFKQANDDFIAANPEFDTTGFLVDGVPRNFTFDAQDLSGKLQLEWRPNDDMLFYAGFNRGTKSGGFNSPGAGLILPADVVFKPEVLHAYEVGAKTTWLDGRMRVNVSTFYYDYKDFQAYFFLNVDSLIISSNATYKGGELELTLSPGNGWNLVAGLALLDTEVNGPAGSGIVEQDAVLAPAFTFNMMLRKEWDLPVIGGHVAVQIAGNYIDTHYPSVLNSETLELGDNWLANGRLSYYSADDTWQASLFVNNIFDERNVTIAYDISGTGNYTVQSIGPPRWIGGNIKYNFN